jgi:hypothetical protein
MLNTLHISVSFCTVHSLYFSFLELSLTFINDVIDMILGFP